MPVSISALPKIAFSKNELNAVLTSYDFVAVDGVVAVNRLVFAGTISTNNTIRLLWANGDLTLTAKPSPDDSGNQFSTGNGLETHVRAVMSELESNYYIDKDFTLSYGTQSGNPCIIFTGRNKSVLLNMSAQTTGNLSVITTTTGVNEEYKANFAHHLEIWAKISGTFSRIYSENLQLDQPVSGVTTKNIAEELNAYLNEERDRPDITANTWQQCTNSLFEYYVAYAQFYGDAPTVKKLSKTTSNFINLGGLDVQNAPNTSLESYLRPGGANNKTLCLRQGSKVKKTQVEQPEMLYWINLTGADVDIRMRIDLYYADGDTNSYTYSPFTALAWQKYYIGVGHAAAQINGHLSGGKACTYYTAMVVSAAGLPLSVKYKYIFDQYREFPRYFIYRNSLGGYQTLYTWGKGQNATSRSKQDVERQQSDAENALKGSKYENGLRIRQSITVNTGYTSKRDLQVLNDLLSSDEKYLVSGTRLIPVGLETTELKFPADGDNLNAVALDFYPLYDEVVFTDDPAQADNTNSSGSGDSGGAPVGYNAIIDDGTNDYNFYYPDL